VQAHHVLIDEVDPDTKHYRLERIDASGTRTTLYEGERGVRDLLLAPDGSLAFIKTLADDYSQVIARRRDGKWEEVTRCPRLRRCSLVAASPDGAHLSLLTTWAGDRAALVEVDANTGARRLAAADPQGIADLDTVVLDGLTRQPMLASYALPQVHLRALASSAQPALAELAARFPHANLAVQASAGPWLVTETGATLSQPRYWLYDAARHRVTSVPVEPDPVPAMDEAQLAAKYPVDYPASDGLRIHGYLTLPPGLDARRVPLVTIVHGGPWSHADSGYDWFVQFLATRGCAVFQPNFRASTGYGDKYMLAPGLDFGNGRVQRDMIEGVRWLNANGIGDPDRMAITGGSFGGYSTLLALTWNPDLFKFGLAMVPPPEFSRTLADSAAADLPGDDVVPFALRVEELGLPIKDDAAMQRIRATAPAAHPDRMNRPLVIMAGAQDRKVQLESVTSYVARLQALGKPVTLYVDPDEGHNARNPVVREAVAHLLERLLHQYLGAPPPAPPREEVAAYLAKTVQPAKAPPP
jgi:dipeptidyl aminopeptidase/acylaminoacyl peptidase